MCFLFQTRSFWKQFGVPSSLIQTKYEKYFGIENREIADIESAKSIILNVLDTIQRRFYDQINNGDALDLLLKVNCIFGEVQNLYLSEKNARTAIVNHNISNDIVNVLTENKEIMRCILDACNIWIENSVLFLIKDSITFSEEKIKRSFAMDLNILIELYIYGVCSQAMSFLTLSETNEGIRINKLIITPANNKPFELDKYHPLVFYNTAITGNQDALSTIPLDSNANETEFGKGFKAQFDVEFLLFLAMLTSFQQYELNCNKTSIRIISKECFIESVEKSTTPKINGTAIYNSFVLTPDKIKSQLRDDEEIIWKMGVNKNRIEIKPFIALTDEYVLVSYALLEQTKNIWISYYSNGGACYSGKQDHLLKAIYKRNQELSDILVNRITEILTEKYTPTFSKCNVDYREIFNQRDIDYGDFDVVFYTEDTNELFLVEAKYFSDSLYASGVVNDYNKVFEKEGYYFHCRRRYDLVLSEPEKLKEYIGLSGELKIHLLFVSSKPLELELQDEDKIVTFIPLSIFKKYLDGKLINESGEMARPFKIL